MAANRDHSPPGPRPQTAAEWLVEFRANRDRLLGMLHRHHQCGNHFQVDLHVNGRATDAASDALRVAESLMVQRAYEEYRP